MTSCFLNLSVEEEFENDEQAVKSSEDILKFRAIDLIDKNKEQIENMLTQSQGETEEIRL